jgi:hypothetical protein
VVLDTKGNEVTHFGGYGNADSCGSDSKDKVLREPEIAFAWLVGMGVTDKYAYMGDSMNCPTATSQAGLRCPSNLPGPVKDGSCH